MENYCFIYLFLIYSQWFFQNLCMIIGIDSVMKVIFLKREREYLLSDQNQFWKVAYSQKFLFKNRWHSFWFFLNASQNITFSFMFFILFLRLCLFDYVTAYHPVLYIYKYDNQLKITCVWRIFWHPLWFFNTLWILWKQRLRITVLRY